MPNRKAYRYLLFVLLMMIATVAGVRAQGVIVPRPCDRCPRPPRPVTLPRALPISSIKIDTKIAGQVATTHVEQVFRNETDATLEGTYLFPIPETASIVEFAIWDGDHKLVGEVRSREEARRIYDEIVRRQRDPGLLEYAGKDLFQASIFPILPRSDKKLEITYTQVLRAESGTVSYRYPLGTGRNMQAIGKVSGRVELEGKDPIRNVYSPSHQIDLAHHGAKSARISFRFRIRRCCGDWRWRMHWCCAHRMPPRCRQGRKSPSFGWIRLGFEVRNRGCPTPPDRSSFAAMLLSSVTAE